MIALFMTICFLTFESTIILQLEVIPHGHD
jgi:hypothetical protein